MAEEKEEKEDEEETGEDIEALLGGFDHVEEEVEIKEEEEKREERVEVRAISKEEELEGKQQTLETKEQGEPPKLVPDSDREEVKEEAEGQRKESIDEDQRLLDILIEGGEGEEEEGKEEIAVEEEEKKEPTKKKVIFEKIKEMGKKKMAIFAGGIFLLAILGFLLAPPLLKYYRVKRLLNRGDAFLKENDLLKAEDEFGQAIKLSKDKIKILNQVGLINLSKGIYPQAFKNFSQGLELDKNSPVTRHNLLKYYLAKQDEEGAFEEAESLLKISPNDLLALKTIGKKYFKEKNYKKARLSFEQVLRLKRDDVQSLSYLQKISLVEKDYNQVLNIRKMLAKLVDRIQNPNILLSAGIFYREAGELDKAEAIFSELLLDNLRFTAARYELARLYVSKGKIEAAIKELEIAVSHDPLAQDVLNLLGEIQYQRGDLEQAGARFGEVLGLNPENAPANYNLGNVHYSFDRMDEAIRFYEKAIASGYRSDQMDYNLGTAYYLKGRHQEAADRWKKLIKKDDPVVFYNLGNAHLYLGHWEEADDNLGKTIDHYSDVLNRELKVERPEDEEKIFRALGQAYNNQGIAKEKKGQEREAMLNYFKALEAASWGEGEEEDKIAKSNLNRVLKSEPLLHLEKAIHPQVEKEHKIVNSRQ